jgi:hypothetical protein
LHRARRLAEAARAAVWLRVVAALVGLALAAPPARADEPGLVLDVTLDLGGGRIFGRAHYRVSNTSTATLASVPLWLYPNHLAERPAALGDVNFHWLYPGPFSPAGMEIGDTRVDGAGASFTIEDTEAGARTLARVSLPRPLPPGGIATLELAFEATLPRRFGAFGCDGPRCRLMGGFYPTPAHLGGGGWDLAAAPDRIAARVAVRAPEDLALVVGGHLARGRGQDPVAAVTDDAPYATLVTDRAFLVSSIDAAGTHVDYLHRHPRPPDSEGQPLPYVREDVPGLVLGAARRALEFLAEQGLPPPRRNLTLVEGQLRHELVQVHGDVILVSDQIFGIFPVQRLRKYHGFELARAVFTAVIGDALARTEAPEDRDLAAGVLASYLLDVFMLREFKTIEFAKDLLRPVDFIPAVDQLMYAPLVASSATYFGDVDAEDPIRDDVRRFAAEGPQPRLVYNKLLDILGPAGMTRLPRAVLGEGKPLREAAAEIFGADLRWFWTQWLGPRPRVNYRLVGVKVTPGPGGGVHVAIDVAREGDDVLEPVEVLVEDRAGGTRTLTWRTRGPRATLEVDLPAGLKAVEVDPRARLVETAVGSLHPSDDPLYDNRSPPRWRLLYEGFGALLNVTELTAAFEAAFLLKPQHDLRHAIVLRATHTDATEIGGGAAYDWFFGQQATKNALTSALEGGLAVSRLNPRFGVATNEPSRPGTMASAAVSLYHDTRDYLIDPWRALGLYVTGSYALTFFDDGHRDAEVGADVEALRLFELLPGHVLAVDLATEAGFGSFTVPAQLTDAGGLGGLRGYLPGQLLARANATGSLQLRDDYLAALDWNLLHLATVRALAGTVFADAAATTTCDDYAFSRTRVYSDVGYSFRVLYDAFGVYQQLLSFDLAFPLRSRDASSTCLRQPEPALPNPARLFGAPFTFLISFLPTF